MSFRGLSSGGVPRRGKIATSRCAALLQTQLGGPPREADRLGVTEVPVVLQGNKVPKTKDSNAALHQVERLVVLASTEDGGDLYEALSMGSAKRAQHVSYLHGAIYPHRLPERKG
jgi:hypothetical protein